MNKKSLNNLKPIRSENEARIKGQMGGIKSGKVRTKKRALKELLTEISNIVVSDKQGIDFIQQNFPTLEIRNITFSTLGIAKLLTDLVGNNIKPAERIKILEFLRDTTEGKPTEHLKIDEIKQQEYELDKKLAELPIEELISIAFPNSKTINERGLDK